MPFITQGKINLKYILIVIVLAVIVGGTFVSGWWLWQWWSWQHQISLLPDDTIQGVCGDPYIEHKTNLRVGNETEAQQAFQEYLDYLKVNNFQHRTGGTDFEIIEVKYRGRHKDLAHWLITFNYTYEPKGSDTRIISAKHISQEGEIVSFDSRCGIPVKELLPDYTVPEGCDNPTVEYKTNLRVGNETEAQQAFQEYLDYLQSQYLQDQTESFTDFKVVETKYRGRYKNLAYWFITYSYIYEPKGISWPATGGETVNQNGEIVSFLGWCKSDMIFPEKP